MRYSHQGVTKIQSETYTVTVKLLRLEDTIAPGEKMEDQIKGILKRELSGLGIEDVQVKKE
jgi:hypothetical protein